MNSSIAQRFKQTIKAVRRLPSALKAIYIGFPLVCGILIPALAAGHPAHSFKLGGGKDVTPPDLIVDGPDTAVIEVTRNPMHPVPVPRVISADDSVDGPLISSVIIDSGKVQTNILGLYAVKYSVSDLSGNTAVVYRYVNVIDTLSPVIKLIGPSPQIVEVFNSYIEDGVSVSDNYYTASKLVPLISVKSNVDTSVVGTYQVTYNLFDPSGNKAIEVTRIVNVIDSLAPVITLNGPATDSMEVFASYNDPGVSVSDNYNSKSNVSVNLGGTFYSEFPGGKNVKLNGSYTIIYTATDKSGNSSHVTRTVLVQDRTAPVITLIGSRAVSICQGASYVDAGYTVTDNYDKTADLVVDHSGSFNGTNTPGLYNWRYKAVDKSGNVGYSDYRYILVKSAGDISCSSGGSSTTIDTTICRGSCPWITAPDSGAKYTWSTGDNTRTIQFCPKSDTTVSVSVTSGSTSKSFIYNIYLTKYSCVWPGDANDDNIADKNDVLAVGVAYADTGAKRNSASINWVGQPCNDWNKSFKSGANYKNADCNGDGTIDSSDLAAVAKNYGKKHTKAASPNGSPTDPPLSISFSSDSAHVGDTVQAVITLGSATVPVKNAYGLSFSIAYNSKYVKPGKAQADLSKCWLGTPGKDLIYLVYDDSANGTLDIAMTRIDHKNVTGYGDLARLSIVMQDNIGGKTWIDRNVYLTPTDVKMIAANESVLPVYATADSMKVYQSGINTNRTLSDFGMDLFPNPVHDRLYLVAGKQAVNGIKIFNALGEEVYTSTAMGTGTLQIPVQSLKPGMYSILLTTKGGNITGHFIKN